VDDIKIRRLGWAGHIRRVECERIPLKSFLIGNFLIRDQWENQEQDGRTLSGGTCHRSRQYEDGGDEKTRKNGDVLWGRQGPRRGCSAIDDWILEWFRHREERLYGNNR
jgi:hypothetical protein